jgi:hypothetical protein
MKNMDRTWIKSRYKAQLDNKLYVQALDMGKYGRSELKIKIWTEV